MKCTAYSRAERSSPADGVSSCKQSPRLSLSSAAPLKNTPFRVCFLMCAKFFAHICTISLKLCVEPVVCARCLFLQAIPHLRLPSAAHLISFIHDEYVVFFFNVCNVFCTHLHNFFEIVRGACRLRSAIENTSCSHRLLLPAAALWFFIIGACRRRYCLFGFST